MLGWTRGNKLPTSGTRVLVNLEVSEAGARQTRPVLCGQLEARNGQQRAPGLKLCLHATQVSYLFRNFV